MRSPVLRLAVLLPLALLMAGFALRVYRAQEQSLSGDEILTVYAAEAPLAEWGEQEATADHPPLYFLFLRVWLGAAGRSEYALRLPSAIFSTLTVALVWTLGRAAGGTSLGALAAALLGLAPLQVFFGQETRGYALMLALALVSLYLVRRIWRRGRWWEWLGWAGAAMAALLAEYVALPLVLLELGVLGAVALRRAWPQRRRWLVAHGVLAGVVLPWVLLGGVAGDVYATGSGASPVAEVFERGATAFAVGQSVEGGWVWTATAAVWALALLGLLRSPLAAAWRWLLAAWLGLTILVVLVGAGGRLGFAPRHAMVAAPALCLLTAAGFLALWRYRRLTVGVPVLVLLPSFAWSLHSYYYEPRFQRDDFRSLAAYLDDVVRHDDAVVFNARWARRLYPYYGERAFTSYGLPAGPAASGGRSAEEALAEVVQRHERIWLVLWHNYFTDPQASVEMWLRKHTFYAGRVAFPRMTVSLFLRQPVLEGGEEVPVPHRWSGPQGVPSLRLLGYGVDGYEAADLRRIFVTLYWEADAVPPESYRVHLRLVDGGDHLYGQADHRPVYDRLVTTTWQTGWRVRDGYRIDLLPGTPAGRYWLWLAVYGDPETGSSSYYQFGRIGTIELPGASSPPSLERLDAVVRRTGRFGDVELLGWTVPAESVAGGKLPVLLFWRSRAALEQAVPFRLRLGEGGAGTVVEQVVAGGDLTFAQQPGTILRQYVDVPVGAASSGLQTLWLEVGDWSAAILAEVDVAGRTRVFAAPQVQHRSGAVLGGLVELLGFDLSGGGESLETAGGVLFVGAPKERLTLTLYWRALAPVGESYKVFVHLLGAADRVSSQHDSLPQNGNAPTSGWVKGEVVEDEHPLLLPSAEGDYLLEVGLYHPLSGERLAGPDDGRIVLGRVRVGD